MVKKLAALLFWVVGVVCSTGFVSAAEQQLCKFNSNCVVGEFVFDDNYAPINVGVTCALLSRDPSGEVFVNSALMQGSGKNDGWYSYAVDVGNTEGVYPTQMCCSVPVGVGITEPSGVGTTQYMCLDKSFKAGPVALNPTETANAVWDSQTTDHNTNGSFGKNNQNPTLTASDIWGYTNRTLSNFGNLVELIWGYTDKSLTSFGSLVADIWGNGTVNTLATKTDVVGVATSLATIEGKIDSLDIKVSSIGTTVGTILNKWGSYSASDIISNVTTVQTRLGANSDTCANNTIFGNIACVKDKWGTQTAQSLYDIANNTLSVGNSLRAELSYNGKSTTAYEDMQTIKSYVDSLETSMSTVGGNVASIKTTVESIETKVNLLDTKVSNIGTSITTLINKWGSYSASDIISNVTTVQTRMGTNSDTCATNSVFGNIACVKDKWGSQTADALYTAANNAYSTATALRTELNYNGKSTNAYDDMQTIKSYVDSLETSIGNTSDLSNATTLFGKIKGNQEVVLGVQTSLATVESNIRADIGNVSSSVGTLLTKWGSYSASDIISNVTTVQTRLGANSDTCANNTIFGNIACVKDKWGSQTAQTLYDTANNAYTTATALRTELNYNGKSTTAYEDMQSIKNYVDSLETSMSTVGSNVAAIKTTVESIETKINALDTKVNSISTSIATLLTKWGSYTVGDVLGTINGIGSSLGTGSDACANNTIFGNIACVKDKWGAQTAESLYTAANSAFTTVTSLRAELDYSGKSSTAYSDLQSVKNYVDSLEASIGSTSDLSSASTLFGKIKGNKEDVAGVSGQVAGVQSSVDSIETKVNLLSSSILTLNTNINTLTEKWGSYTVADVMNNITNVRNSIGTSGDVCGSTTTIFGGIACLQNNGGGGDTATLLTAIGNVSSLVTGLTTELNYNGKSTTAYEDVQAIKTNLGIVLTAMGSSTDNANTATVFGRMKKIQSTVEALNNVDNQATTVVDKWGTLSASDIYDKVKDLASQISNINTVSNVSSILTVSQSSATDLQALKNQILAMKALVNVNKTLLEKTVVKPMVKTWLEEGSIIFKTMITNPSTVRQTVPLKFYLPKEANKNNIIKIDAGLDVIYDPTEEANYVSGEFDLGPDETRIVAIEVEDVWKISESQIESLKLQVDELSKPLKNTPYFAQGITLKSDITVQLDNILRTQKETITPDSRISVYRKNSDQLKRVQDEITDLKGLVTSVSSSGSLMGFVGGSQTISLWGVVVILIVGIVLLTVYMRTVINQFRPEDKKTVSHWPKISHHINNQIFRFAFLIIITTVPTFAGTWMIMDKVAVVKPDKKTVAMSVKITPTRVPTLIPTIAIGEKSEAVLGIEVEKTKLAIPEGSTSMKIRILPDAESTILARLWTSWTVDKYSEKDEWIEIGTNLNIDGKTQYVRGWVRKICEVTL